MIDVDGYILWFCVLVPSKLHMKWLLSISCFLRFLFSLTTFSQISSKLWCNEWSIGGCCRVCGRVKLPQFYCCDGHVKAWFCEGKAGTFIRNSFQFMCCLHFCDHQEGVSLCQKANSHDSIRWSGMGMHCLGVHIWDFWRTSLFVCKREVQVSCHV